MTKEIEDMAACIRVALAEKGISRKELAQMTGISLRKINKICDAKYDIHIDEVSAIESALGITLMIIPDTERVVTITMRIDSMRGVATIGMVVTENGKTKEYHDWKAKELTSTASALMMKARVLSDMATEKAREDEKAYIQTLQKLIQYENREANAKE